MKILQINSVVNFGSTGMIARELYTVLVNEGHESLIVFGRGPVTPGYRCVKIGNKLDNYFHGLGSLLLDAHGLFSKKATKKLINIIRMYKPDIIQLHNIHGYYLNYPLLFDFLKDYDVPIVWLMHDQWAISGGPAYVELLENKLERTKNERYQYPKLIGIDKYLRNYKLKSNYFTNMPQLVIVTPSDWLAYHLKNSFFIDSPIYTIHNGIDIDRFSPNQCPNIYQKKVLIGVANVWDDRKGAKYFVRLAEDLGDVCEILLVGVDKKMEQEFSKLGISIKCFPKTSSVEEMVSLYSAADILVNPTLQDNFPTVNLEAQACGTPVITFDTGGSGESVVDYVTGRVISSCSYSELLDAVVEWPKKNDRIIKACRKNAMNYDKNVIYQQYMKLYKDLMEKDNGLEKNYTI